MAKNDYQREMERLEGNYSVYGAEQDSGAMSISKLVGDKLGPGFEQIMRDLVLAIQGLTGMQNKGVSSAMNILGGIQNYGAPGMMPGGGSGLIGGHGITSIYAAQALQRDVMRDFYNPLTNAPNSRAYGLNQAEMGQAANLVFRSGRQYGMGNIYESREVTEQYRQQQISAGQQHFRQTGDKSLLQEAEGLQIGGQHTIMSDSGKQKMRSAIQDMNATLGAIKDVMGDQSLKNLEDTMQKLFGGDIMQFGERAARMRMAQVKALSANYGGGPEGVQKAVAALGASAAVTNTGSAALDFHTAIYSERMAQAGGRASLMNQGVAAANGYYIPPTSHGEKNQTVSQQTGAIAGEEEELLLAQITLQSQGGGTATQKKRMSQAREKLKRATTEEELFNARQELRAFTYEMDENANLEKYGGAQEARKMLSPEEQASTAADLSFMVQNRNQSFLGKIFGTEKRFTTQMGLSSEQASAFGLGAANMDPRKFQELQDIMNEQYPDVRAARMREFKASNPGVEATLGANADEFWKVAESGKITGQQARAFTGAASSYAETKGFVPKYAQDIQAQEEYQAQVASNYQGKVGSGDFLQDLLKGVYGDRTWTSQEKMNEIINAKGSYSEMETEEDRFKGTKSNLETLRKTLTDEEQRSMGMPTDDAEAMKWMQTAAGSRSIQEALKSGDRAFTMMDGKAYVAGSEEAIAAGKRLSEKAIVGDYATKTDELVKSAAYGGVGSKEFNQFQDIYEDYSNDPAAKERFSKSIQDQMTKVNSYLSWADKGIAGEVEYTENGKTFGKDDFIKRKSELQQWASGLEEMSSRYLSGASNATVQKGPVTMNVSGAVNINSNTKPSASS